MTIWRPLRHRLVAVPLIGLGLVAGLVSSYSAFAQITTCRTDPVVTLSDGSVVQMWADIGDDPVDVTGISYALHGPKGTRVVSVQYSGDVPPTNESFTFVADKDANQYQSQTTVETGSKGINVQATTNLTSAAGGTATHATHGHNHDQLKNDVKIETKETQK